jgi:hypothetical protein
VELALLSVLSDVVIPFDRAGLPVESTDHAITGADDKQVTHDRGSEKTQPPLSNSQRILESGKRVWVSSAERSSGVKSNAERKPKTRTRMCTSA